MKLNRLLMVAVLAIGCASPFTEKETTTGPDGKSDQFGEVEECSWETNWRFDTTADLEPFIESRTTYRAEDADEMPALSRKQVLDAFIQEPYSEVEGTDVSEAFANADDGVIIVLELTLEDDTRLDWVKWYAGDTQVGVIYQANTLVAETIVSDGDFMGCGAADPIARIECTYGSWVYEESGEIEVIEGSEHTIDAETGATTLERDQILAAVYQLEFTTGEEAFEEAFEAADGGEFYLHQAIDADQKVYDWVQFYAGDTEVGVLFDTGTLTIVAEVGDGDISGCATDEPAQPDTARHFQCSYDNPWETDSTEALEEIVGQSAERITEENIAEAELIVGQQIYEAAYHLEMIEVDAEFNAIWDAADEGFYLVRTFDSQEQGEVTWIKFYAGDTEIGAIFPSDSTEILAEVSDGDIIGCVEDVR